MRKVLQCPPVPFAPPVPACFTAPHLYLPPLVEDTGTTYADATEAQSVLDDALRVNQNIGTAGIAFNSNPDTASFEAFAYNSGYTYYDIYLSLNSPVIQTAAIWVSLGITTPDDKVIFEDYDERGIRATIYNANGTLRETVGDFSEFLVTSSALPVERYIFAIELSASPSATDFNPLIYTEAGTLMDNLTVAATYPGAPCPNFIPYP